MLARSVRQKLLVVAPCGVFLYLFLNLNFDSLVEGNAQNAEAALTTTTTTTTAAAAITTTTEESEEELDFLEFMVFREGEEEEEGYAVNINPIALKENEERNTENKTLETSSILPSPETNPVQKPTPPGPRNAIRLPLAEFPSVSDCGSNSDPSRVNKSIVYPCKHWHYVNKRDKVWPVILKPSNGKLLQWLSKRRYDDPEVRTEGCGRTYAHSFMLFFSVVCCCCRCLITHTLLRFLSCFCIVSDVLVVSFILRSYSSSSDLFLIFCVEGMTRFFFPLYCVYCYCCCLLLRYVMLLLFFFLFLLSFLRRGKVGNTHKCFSSLFFVCWQ